MNKLKKGFLTLVLMSVIQLGFAGEGMWIPLLLKALVGDMQSMGMKMTAEDIYSVNQGSLKDAVVHFGGFCTGEVISDQGLVLTNHHCGYGAIQSHSSLENNYLEDGFWAMKKGDELSNPGLFVTFIDRIDDVSEKVLDGVTEKMTEKDRQSQIDKNIKYITDNYELNAFEEVKIRPFFHGNQYFLFKTITYPDVRLVGAPPSSIGKFGADTDNWVWPRHTGDFAMFRIYAGKDNKPAEYSEDNIPFTPKHSLPVSVEGVEEGDFTMIFGFPGRTDSYLPAAGLKLQVDKIFPARITVRDKTLAIYNREMRADPEVKIQYASKQSRLSNAWKKWQGVILGINRTDGIGRKEKFEAEFREKLASNPEWKRKYGNLLSDYRTMYSEISNAAVSRAYYDEITNRNVEILRIAQNMIRLVSDFDNQGVEGYKAFAKRLKPYLANFYKDYRPSIDQEVMGILLEMYVKNIDQSAIPEYLNNLVAKSGGNYQNIADQIFTKSMFDDRDKVMATLEKDPVAAVDDIRGDIAYQLMHNWKKQYDDKIAATYNKVNEKIDVLDRTYMAALMEVFPKRDFYPDANSTLRVTYGQVEPYEPRDAVQYGTTTYLSGVMEKYKPGDYEFDVPIKLRKLYMKKDFGEYDENGRMPVCFIGSNHTTGGNSGSPAIDAYGNLIGLNFDRAWEGTMSDLNYDRSICRNIMVDARYILFIVDKFAGAGHLVEEMKLVRPKTEAKKNGIKKNFNMLDAKEEKKSLPHRSRSKEYKKQ